MTEDLQLYCETIDTFTGARGLYYFHTLEKNKEKQFSFSFFCSFSPSSNHCETVTNYVNTVTVFNFVNVYVVVTLASVSFHTLLLCEPFFFYFIKTFCVYRREVWPVILIKAVLGLKFSRYSLLKECDVRQIHSRWFVTAM